MAMNIPKYKQIRSKQINASQEADEAPVLKINSTQDYIDSFTSKNKDKRVGFRIQASLYNQFAKICRQEGVSVSSKINQLISTEVSKHE